MTTKFNFLESRAKTAHAPSSFSLTRRPGIGKIIAELEREHPTWRQSRIEARAKAIWTERNQPGRKAG